MRQNIADVVIVGAGASGAAAAWRLAGRDLSVVCLEQGRWFDHKNAVTTGPGWEVAGKSALSADPNVRALPEDYPVGAGGSPIKPLMYNGVGGSTLKWGCTMARLHPSDFRVKSMDGVADDWPIEYEDLAPYYDLNDRMMGVSGVGGNPSNPPAPDPPLPRLPFNPADQRLAAAFDLLGWHWWPTDSAIASEQISESRAACNHCGPCGLGCPRGAKGGTDVTYWPAAIDRGCQLVTGARAFEIRLDKAGRATGVAYYDADGRARIQHGRVILIGCNGIGTPRLLLLSTSGAFPNGLANSSGMVGRNLMLHPTALVTGVFDELVDSYKGAVGATLLSQEFYETDPRRGFVRGFQMHGLRSEGPVGVAVGDYVERIPWGTGHHAAFQSRFGRILSLTVTAEDLPDPDNRVTLDEHLADPSGTPAPKVFYEVSDNTWRMIDFGLARAKEVFEAAGTSHLVIQRLIAAAGFHLMGTARMGSDRERSVTKPWGQSHDVPNLYVVDGSLFVTSGAANPTATLQALALRAADHVVANRRELNVSEPGK